MKYILLIVALLTFSAPAHAQLGGLTGALKKVQDSKQKYDDVTFTDAEERQIGDQVSAKIRERFGVDIANEFAGPLRALAAEGWLTVSAGAVRLTRHALLRVDRLLPRFYDSTFQEVRYT